MEMTTCLTPGSYVMSCLYMYMWHSLLTEWVLQLPHTHTHMPVWPLFLTASVNTQSSSSTVQCVCMCVVTVHSTPPNMAAGMLASMSCMHTYTQSHFSHVHMFSIEYVCWTMHMYNCCMPAKHDLRCLKSVQGASHVFCCTYFARMCRATSEEVWFWRSWESGNRPWLRIYCVFILGQLRWPKSFVR